MAPPAPYDALVRRASAVITAAVLLFGAGLVWVVRAAPLEAGSYFFCGRHQVADRGESCIVEYHDGRDLLWAFSVRNGGPVGVTVTGVVAPRDGLLLAAELLMWPRNGVGGFDEDAFVPFAPFELPPGQERVIAYVSRFGGCEDYVSATSATIGKVEVRFRLLGVPRGQETELLRSIEVPAPVDCPGR